MSSILERLRIGAKTSPHVAVLSPIAAVVHRRRLIDGAPEPETVCGRSDADRPAVQASTRLPDCRRCST